MDIKIEINKGSIKTKLSLLFSDKIVTDDILKLRQKWTGGKVYNDIASWKKTLNEPDLIYYSKFKFDVSELLKRLNQSPLFDTAIEQAILMGKVTQFSRVKLLPIPYWVLEELEQQSEQIRQEGKYEDALIVFPETSEEEITKALNDLKKANIETLKSPGNNPPYKVKQAIDVMSNVGRDKKWYFMHLPKSLGGEGRSYFQIALEYLQNQKNKYTDDKEIKWRAQEMKETVRKAIKSYAKHLKAFLAET